MEHPPYLDRLREKFGTAIEESYTPDDQLTLVVKRDSIVDLLSFLKDDEETLFDQFMDLTAVDYLGKEPRFEVVIHLVSIPKLHRIRVKIKLEEGDPTLPTITKVYPGANWFERECWDLYGIKFQGPWYVCK